MSRFFTPSPLFPLLAVFLLLCAVAPLPARAYVDPSTGAPRATRVLRPADLPERNWQPGHRGVDLALAPGEEVLAAEAGRVAFAGVVAGTPSVSIDHPDGIRTSYLPVHAWVAEGAEVQAGEVIGILAAPVAGHEGLHWGARTAPALYLNPLSLLEGPTIRLKPVDAPA